MDRRLQTAAFGAATAVALVSAAPAQADPIAARLSYHWAPSHHSAIYSQKFADCVNEKGAEKVHIDTFPSGQLFGIREVMGALTAGAVEMGGVVGIVSFPPVNKNYNVEALPGYFNSFEQLRGFFNDTDAGKQVWQDILDRTQTVVLAYNPTGPFMAFTSVHPLTSPEAFQGLKARYLTGVERPRWSALGADALSMPTREVYTALQNGMIDTFATVPSAIKAYDWWEYVKYGQKPYQFYADAFIMANRAWFDGLPDDVKETINACGKTISDESTASVMQFSEEVLKEFEERGGQVDTLSDEELEAFRKIDEEKVLPGMSDLIDPEVLKAAGDYVGR